jgi:hypothetical protein
MLRKLKRTIAVTCLLATACFVILWMRSLNYRDVLEYRQSDWSILGIESREAGVEVFRLETASFGEDVDTEVHFQTWPVETTFAASFHLPFAFAEPQACGICIPYCNLICISGAVGVALLVRRPFRFSIRTLAMAATLIIVTLGLGVAASRLTLS